MPRKYTVAKRRRRRYRRKKKKYKIPTIISSRHTCRLKYLEQVDLNPGTGGSAHQVFRANGLFDPNASVGGHQPRGFDQMMALFDHYTVIGAKIRADFMSTGNTTNHICLISTQDDAVTQTDPAAYIENKYTTYKYQGGSDTQPVTITKAVNPAKFLGRTNPLDDDELRGDALADPTEGVFFHVSTFAPNFTGNPDIINTMVSIEYVVVFSEPKLIPGS